MYLEKKLYPNLLIFLLQKRFIQTNPFPLASPLPTTGGNTSVSSSSFYLQFLVNSCGLPLETAKLHLDEKNIHKTQSLLQFLKSHHFQDTHIANLIKKRPTFLRCRVEGNLKPTFEFLIANGIPGNLLPQLTLADPVISERSLDSSIKPSFEFLKSVLGSNEKLVVAVKRCPRLLHADLKRVVQPNVEFLIKEGVPLHRLAKLIISYPRSLLHKLVDAVNTVKTQGLEPNDTMFIHALRVRVQMTDTTWKKKIEVMKSLGWSEEEILGTFKRYPCILGYSEKKIRSNMDFLINTVEMEREILLVYPCLLYLSVDERIRPRYNVIYVLKSKNLIKGDKKFPPLLMMSEKKFLANYVDKYVDDVPGLLEVYRSIVNTKKQVT